MSNSKNLKKKRSYKFLTLITLFAIPFFLVFEVIIINNQDKFNDVFKYYVLGMLIFLFCLLLFLICFNKYFRINSFKRLGILLVFLSFVLEVFGVVKLIYYNDTFKSWLIKSSFGSINYQNVATSIYGDDIIDEIVYDNDVKDLSGDIVNFGDIKYNDKFYANKYEEEILDREDGALYKIINISGTTIGADYHYEGYMAVIYDPSKVKLAKSSGAGVTSDAYGETLSVISMKNNAVIAMNAGGDAESATGTWTDKGNDEIELTFEGDAQVCACDGDTLVFEMEGMKLTLEK